MTVQVEIGGQAPQSGFRRRICGRRRPVVTAGRRARSGGLTLLSRVGVVLVAGASLSTLSAFAATPSASGASSAAAGSTSVSYLSTLAGFSGAAMYPSGLIWDSNWPGGSGGPTQVIVVADTGYNRVSIFDPTTCPSPDTSVCTPIESFGTYGSAAAPGTPAQFNTPRDVAVDQESNIYVADAANNRIQAFKADGTFLWTAGGAGNCSGTACLNTPIGVSFDTTDDEVLVADTGHSVIKAYAGEGYSLSSALPGTFLWSSPTGAMKSPREARRGPDGEIWVADYNNERVVAFQCTCTTSITVGTPWNTTANKILGDGLPGGHKNGEVNSPYNVTFSSDAQYAFVADTGNERIAVFDVNGCSGTCRWVANIGSRCPTPCANPPGNEPYFSDLRRVTIDPSGNLWGADFWGSGIHEFSFNEAGPPYSSPIGEIDGGAAPAPGFAEPYGVTVGPDGTTYVVDRLNQRIEEFSSTGAYLTDEGQRGVAPGQYSWPETAAVAPDGTVWVGDTRNGRLQHFASDLSGTPKIVGTKGSGVGLYNWIEGVSVASNGVVWAADSMNNYIESYDPSKTTSAFAIFGSKGNGNGKFNAPEGVAVSATDIYVADTGNNRIEELTLSGGYVGSYTGVDAPQGIALAPDGSLWVANSGTSLTDTNGNNIVHLSSTLTLLSGGFGGPGAGNMELAQPHSLSLSPDGNTLFVADTYNNRVQEFSISTSGGPPTQLAFNGTPGGAAPGALLTPQPTVTVEDAGGNPVTTDTSAVTLAITQNTGTSGAALTCTGGLTVTAVEGVASFSGCAINDAGAGYTITAADATDSLSGTSSGFNVTADTPTKLAFTRSPGGGAPKNPLTPQPVVTVEDAAGNAVTSDSSLVTIGITLGTGASGATLTCTDTGGLTVQATSGVATFSGCSVNDAGTGYTLTATDSGDSLPPITSSPFNVSSSPFGPVYTSQIYSPTGAASIYPDGGTVDANGNVYITDSGNSQVLEEPKIATVSPGFPIAAAPGGAAQLAFTTIPTNAAPGTSFSSQPVVAVEDAAGDTVTSDASTVTLAITSGTGAGTATLTCTPGSSLTVAAVNGVAAFSGCSIDTSGTGYTLTATDNSLAPAISPAFNIANAAPGPATQIVFTAAPGGDAPGAAFASQPVVTVEDANGSTVGTDTSSVTLSITPGTGTSGANLTCSGGLSVAAVGGVATFRGCAIDTAGADYTLTAIDSTYGTLRVIVPPSWGLSHPRGLELDPSGQDIWVPDTENNRLVEFTLNGVYKTTLGSSSTSGGSLKSPYGVVFDGTNAYVADTYGYNVVAFSMATKKVAWTQASASPIKAGTGCDGKAFTRTRGIGFGPDGNLYVTDTDNNRIVVLNTSGQCLSVFGSVGSGTSVGKQVQLSAPRDVIGDGNAGLWISDAGNHRIEHVTLTGNLISTTTGGDGTGPGQFSAPQTLFTNGALIDVSDTYNYDIEEFTVDGSGNPVYLDRIAQGTPPSDPGFNGAWSVAYGPSGELYATDWFNHRVEKFNPDGSFAFAFGSYGAQPGQLEYPRGVAVSPDGTYVAVAQENNNIALFNSDGTYKTEFSPTGGLHRPRQVVIAPDGTLWIADYGHNRVLHLCGITIVTGECNPAVKAEKPGTILLNLTTGPGGAKLNEPEGVVLDDAGHVLVADSGNNKVEEYNTNGSYVATLTTTGNGSLQTKFPAELAVIGPSGGQILLIADSGNNRMLAVNLVGSTATANLSFGSLGSGPGQFNTPDSVAYNPIDGQVAVADFLNNRLSLWTTSPPIASILRPPGTDPEGGRCRPLAKGTCM
jgi:DNA-binding beta-propeller fold protein YncE